MPITQQRRDFPLWLTTMPALAGAPDTPYLWIILTLALLLAVILVIIVCSYQRYRAANQRIREQNGQMQQALQALEQSQADNTRMMQIAAHDLRSPVGAIFSLAELMLEGESRPAEDHQMLEMIKTSSQNALELFTDLLQVHTRAEPLPKEDVDMDALLQYCVQLLRHKADAKAQTLVLDSLPVHIQANGEKLWRVVSNLVANAIKFSPVGGTIHIALSRETDRVTIAVNDHGVGIPAAMADKIFDMFTEARRMGTAGEQPFGLGLAISKQIVEAHDGHIWFESPPGNGTTFFVELPASNTG